LGAFEIAQLFQHGNDLILFFDQKLSTWKGIRKFLCLGYTVFEIGGLARGND